MVAVPLVCQLAVVFMSQVPLVAPVQVTGAAVPLVDIRYFLGLGQKEGLAGTKVIVTDVGHNIVGVMVDDVDEALDIEEASIQPPLATIKGKLAEFSKGQVQLGNEIVVLLELKKILNCEEIENLKNLK